MELGPPDIIYRKLSQESSSGSLSISYLEDVLLDIEIVLWLSNEGILILSQHNEVEISSRTDRWSIFNWTTQIFKTK